MTSCYICAREISGGTTIAVGKREGEIKACHPCAGEFKALAEKNKPPAKPPIDLDEPPQFCNLLTRTWDGTYKRCKLEVLHQGNCYAS